MKKGLIYLSLLTLALLWAQGQQHLLLKGQTRDSVMAPVAFANVMAVDTLTQEMKGFAITDVSGNFQLKLEKGRVYELKVTFVGYVPVSQYLQFDDQPDEPLMIIMQEAINALDEVTVVAEMPVVVRGDTISYKAEAFTKGDERKLEDVLEELPGFRIRDNGDIEVQGKKVDKVLVDGKEFFEGDSKLATKNIPADVVDRVQVLQNFNDIAPMRGLGDDQQLALNIELKGDKKQMVFGDIEAGGGPEQRYFGHANAFYYAPKTSVNFIGDGNNVGELSLTMSDYFRMAGGMGAMAARNGTNFRVNAADFDIPLTDRNTAGSLTNYLGALNFTTRPSDKLQLSGFAIGFDNQVDMASNSFRTYPQLTDETTEQLTTTSLLDNQSALGRFAVKYTPNYNLQVDYSFFGKRGNIGQQLLRSSQLLSGSNQLQEGSDRQPRSQNHQLRMFNALNQQHIISAEVRFSDEQNVTGQELVSEQALFSPFLSSTSPLLQLNQDQTINTRRLDGAFNYYYVVNKTTHINVAFGLNISQQSLSSSLTGEGENFSRLDQTLHITNRYARLLYKKKWNRLTISPGVSFNDYTVLGVGETQKKANYFFPQLRTLYEFGNSHNLELTYRQSIEYNDVTAYTEGYRMSRYNTLLFGNSALSPSIYHTLGLDYNNYNMYNFFNIYGGINAQYITDGFTSDQQLQGVENVLTPINTGIANRIVSGYLTLEKRFDHFRVSGGVNLSRTVLNNQFEGQVIENDNFAQGYNLNASAKLFKKLSLRTGYAVNVNRYASGNVTSRFVNYRPNVGATLVINGWRLETYYAYNSYVNKRQNQTTAFDVLDASLSYRKKKSAWEFKLQGLNLLDTRSVRRDSFSDNMISTYSYAIQQRYGLLTVMFDL